MITAICINNYIEGHCDDTDVLQIEQEYEVDWISMGQYYTYIRLKEFGDRFFNSVFFEFYEDGEPLNIFEDDRFNPYLERGE